MANLQLPANISKADISEFIESVTSEVIDGNISPLSVHVRCKALIKALEGIIENTQDIAIDEAYHFKGAFSIEGANVVLREGHGMPDFTQDEVCNNLAVQLKQRQELLKQAFRMNGKAVIVDPDTGEIVPVLPMKPNKTTLTVTFK
jgi:hypothetical protein